MKKIIFILFLSLGIAFAFSNINTVKAENMPQETIIEYSQSINTKKLEEIKASKFKVLAMPKVNVRANPTQDFNKYYYKQLNNDISMNAYNILESQVNNKVKVDLNNYECDISQETEEMVVEIFEKDILPYVLDGYEAYIMDSGEHYWWTSDLKIGNIEVVILNGKVTFKNVEISSQMEEWSEYNSFITKLKETSRELSGNSVYEIVRAINYYICNNIQYTSIDGTDVEQTAYGALMKNKAVCEGQAQLFNLMCREKGIISLNVYGFTNENNTSTAHAWNYVYEPSKEQWYAVDVTWNNYYKDSLYLMIGSNTTTNGIQFGTNHIAGFKQYTVQTYTPVTPVLAAERYIEPITIDGNYIKNIQPNTKYEDFVKEFSNDIVFTVKEGNNIVTGTATIKTGQTFTAGENTYILVVSGDINGDGQADIKDILQINKHRLNKIQLTNEYLRAGDVNKDGIVDIKDILQINKYRLGKISEF